MCVCVCVWEERVGEWTNDKACVFCHQRKTKTGRIWKGAVALQLSVWDVYGLEGDDRLVLVGNFLQKYFFLGEDYLLVLKGMDFVWERLSSSHSECAECKRCTCVPVHPSLLLLPRTWCINLRFKSCTPKSYPLPAADQTLIIQSSISRMFVLVHRSFTVSVCPCGFASSEISVLDQMKDKKNLRNCKICFGV